MAREGLLRLFGRVGSFSPCSTRAEKTSMTLSKETLEGLRLTGVHIMYDCRHSILLISISFIYAVRSFVEATRYLLTLPGVTGQYLLSERFSQDPLENYFSRQRASEGRCDNPTASNTLNCAQSLRVQGSLALQSVRGNCSHKRRLFADKQPVMMTHHCRKGQGRSNRCPLYLSFHFEVL